MNVVEVDLNVQVTMRMRDDVEPFDALSAVLMAADAAGREQGFEVVSMRPVAIPKQKGQVDEE